MNFNPGDLVLRVSDDVAFIWDYYKPKKEFMVNGCYKVRAIEGVVLYLEGSTKPFYVKRFQPFLSPNQPLDDFV